MNIYEYNSSTVNEYSQEDLGLLTTSSWEVEDCGNLSEQIDSKEDFYRIDCKETLLPFGKIRISNNKTKYQKDNNIFRKYIEINARSIILHGVILRWIGFSVIFQLSNDLERKVIPDVSGGGQS